MINLLCFIKGHNFTVSQYTGVTPCYTTPMITVDMFGVYELHKSEISDGFMYGGLTSKCDRCGKSIDSEYMNLPILQPEYLKDIKKCHHNNTLALT